MIVDFENHFSNPADKFHVDAASGWIGLGDLDSAREELKQISPEIQNHPAVLLVQSELLFAEENWEPLRLLTDRLLVQFPKLDFLWINRNYALHELKRTQEAFDALLPAVKKSEMLTTSHDWSGIVASSVISPEAPLSANAQGSFPSQPIRMVVGFPAGGPT